MNKLKQKKKFWSSAERERQSGGQAGLVDAERRQKVALWRRKRRAAAYQPFLSCFGGIDVSGLTERNHMSVNLITNSNPQRHTQTAQDASPEKISDLKLNINSSSSVTVLNSGRDNTGINIIFSQGVNICWLDTQERERGQTQGSAETRVRRSGLNVFKKSAALWTHTDVCVCVWKREEKKMEVI